jgi:hypothetical protein
MTEAEWLGCTDPEAMLEVLQGRVSERKQRLFACACCRRILHLLHDDRVRPSIEVIERYADGSANEARPTSARGVAQEALEEVVGRVWDGYAIASEACCVVRNATSRFPEKAARETVLRAAAALTAEIVGPCSFATPDLVHHVAWHNAHQAGWQSACRELCRLIRDVFGNPFRLPRLTAYWLAAHDNIVPKLAQGIYGEGAFDRVPILGDALEDAGCNDIEILHHCHEPGEHVRGCWVVDLVLGKG